MSAVSESIKIHFIPSLPFPAEEEVSNIGEGCEGVTRENAHKSPCTFYCRSVDAWWIITIFTVDE